MIGVFSVLYFFANYFIKFKEAKKAIIPYFTTSILAGISSMIMILPMYLDLRANGETLSSIDSFKTEATGLWDIIMKNMIGVYDTTKYGSIPFIYIGLFPLMLCIFYFCLRNIPLKNKIAFGSIFAILIASFYIEPLNLFWHGMHSPNMFLFRYSFLFSFLVIILGGYALEKLDQKNAITFCSIAIVLIILFSIAINTTDSESYTYVTNNNYLLTIIFVFVYAIAVVYYQFSNASLAKLGTLLLILMTLEATTNGYFMVNGILDDWNYASRSLYDEPREAITDLVAEAEELNDDTFYRTENIDPISANDSLNFGYSGISLFSSIRNRNSSSLLNQLGFRSRGTSLNTRYDNNTLLMDSLFGIKYNLGETPVNKYGFSYEKTTNTYSLYENSNALSLGILTDSDIFETELPDNDNLTSQTNLINQLSGLNLDYYSFVYPTVTNTNNTEISDLGENGVVYSEIESNVAKDITWTVTIPAGKQAYLSLFPKNFSQLESSTASVRINGIEHKTQISINGQYYNLGSYEEETELTFTVSFYGTEKVSFINPPIVLLDLDYFDQAIDQLKTQEVDFTVSGRKAEATLTAESDQVLFTTIPYDEGWSAYVDGKKVETEAFSDGLLCIPVTEGEHTIKLVYLPPGFIIGVALFIIGIVGFYLFDRFIYKKKFVQIS